MFENVHHKVFKECFLLGTGDMSGSHTQRLEKCLTVYMKSLHNLKTLRDSTIDWFMKHKTSYNKWWKMKTKNSVRFWRLAFARMLAVGYAGPLRHESNSAMEVLNV